MNIDKQPFPAGDPDKILALAKSVLATEVQAVLALWGLPPTGEQER